jgi:hypothetical protein
MSSAVNWIRQLGCITFITSFVKLNRPLENDKPGFHLTFSEANSARIVARAAGKVRAAGSSHSGVNVVGQNALPG